MNLWMVGVDYNLANIEQREFLSIGSKERDEIASRLLQVTGGTGVILLSTCNRTEVWMSGVTQSPLQSFLSIMSQVKNRKEEDWEEIFTVRTDVSAIDYLFELGCGLHSQIFGEDQILAQLKEASTVAREGGYSDSVLETLFRTAITAAKKVKTTTVLTKKDATLPAVMIEVLNEKYDTLIGSSCLVIGNGEMGRMMSKELVSIGCNTEMTLRQYKKKEAIIPTGCGVVLYEERYHSIKEKQFIFSATTSPHYTVKKEEVKCYLNPNQQYVFVDMAVPRDIDPTLNELENVTVLHMDEFHSSPKCEEHVLESVHQMLRQCRNDFLSWHQARKWAPVVNHIGVLAGELTDAKLTKVYKAVELTKEEKELLQIGIQEATKKAVSKLIYSLRDTLEEEHQRKVLMALEQAAVNYK